jgi:hypothetical protein
MLVLLIGWIYDVSRSDGFMRHGIPTKFDEDWHRRSSNIQACLRNLRGCNVGTTDGRDL